MGSGFHDADGDEFKLAIVEIGSRDVGPGAGVSQVGGALEDQVFGDEGPKDRGFGVLKSDGKVGRFSGRGRFLDTPNTWQKSIIARGSGVAGIESLDGRHDFVDSSGALERAAGLKE